MAHTTRRLGTLLRTHYDSYNTHRDIDINKSNITKAILEAAELLIPKSSGKTSTTPYWKNNMGIRMAKHSYNT